MGKRDQDDLMKIVKCLAKVLATAEAWRDEITKKVAAAFCNHGHRDGQRHAAATKAVTESIGGKKNVAASNPS